MRSHANRVTLLLFFAFFLMGSGLGSPGWCFESWEGEIINTAGLKEAPDLDQKTLSDLKPGSAVTVIDRNGDWCQIVAKVTKPRQKGQILGKFGIPQIFTHEAGKQAELKGWVMAKDIKRISGQTETTGLKEKEITPEPSGEEKEKLTPEPQEIKTAASVEQDVKTTALPAAAEQEKSQSTGKEEEKIESLPPAEGKEVSTQPAEIITAPEKTFSPPSRNGIPKILTPEKEEIISKAQTEKKTTVFQESQEKKTTRSKDSVVTGTPPLQNGKQEKIPAPFLKSKAEEKTEALLKTTESKKTEPRLETRLEKNIEPQTGIEETTPAQPTGVIPGPEKNISSEKREAQRDREKTSPLQDEQDAARDTTKGASCLKDAFREIALLAIGIVACLAFVFSFRAYRLAQACYRTILRLQAGRENFQKKEERKY